MMKTNNLRKESDRGIVASDNINIKIRDQELIAPLGPSGCGKSIIFNCIVGLLDITSGEILLNGENVIEKAPEDRSIGMVFQSYVLHPHLKVIDNTAFLLKQKSMRKEERHQKVRETAKKLQTEHLLDRRPTQPSDGQQRRMAICRTLVKEPKILFPDESMPNLDARLEIEIREVIKTIRQELKVTSITVTYNQEEAMAIADRIAIPDSGNTQQYDTPDMLYEYPVNLFVASFMGSPPMNFIGTVIEKQDGGCVYMTGGCRIPISSITEERMEMHTGKKVKPGVRSHQVTVEREPSHGTLPVRMQVVKNLGKEFLVIGDIGENHIRTILDDTSRLQELKEKVTKDDVSCARLINKINVLDEETKANLVL